jgi:hypothetical protein
MVLFAYYILFYDSAAIFNFAEGVMRKISCVHLARSFFLLFISTLGGMAIIEKTVDDEAAVHFLKVGLFICFVMIAFKVLIFAKAKKFLFYQLLFIASFIIDLAWLLSCLFLPLFWMHSISTFIKIAVLLFFVFVCICNVRLALSEFDKGWAQAGSAKFEKLYKDSQDYVEWEQVTKSLRMTAVIYLPGARKKYEEFVSLVLFFLFIFGASFQKSHPGLGMAMLAIPCTISVACLLQISTYHFAQALLIHEIEGRKNTRLKSVD